MDQITITREEFRKKIKENPKGYGIVRAMRKTPEKMKATEMQMFIEELTMTIILAEVEADLFGPEKQDTEEAEPAVQELPFC
jgi:hypothetical protein